LGDGAPPPVDGEAEEQTEEEPPRSRRFSAQVLDPQVFTPVTFPWRQRIVGGVLNILAGEEGVGKGTAEAWMIARWTRGELPGEYEGRPARILWIGDEDSCRHVVGPRLHAADADLSYVSEVVGSNGSLLNVSQAPHELDALIAAGRFEIVVFEQLLDNVGPLRNPTDPYEVRAALRPLRGVLHRREATAVATLHTNKLRGGDFRSKLSGSHQWNALSRSSLLIAHHPDGGSRRALVGGKANYSAPPTPLTFDVRTCTFVLNGYVFEEPLACEFTEAPELDLEAVLAGPRSSSKPNSRDEVREALLSFAFRSRSSPSIGGDYDYETWTRDDLARGIGRHANDRVLGEVLEGLVRESLFEREGAGKRGDPYRWRATEDLLSTFGEEDS
jgi:hypothetical protein